MKANYLFSVLMSMLLACSLSTNAVAEEPKPLVLSPDVSTFGELDQLRAKHALLDAQVSNAELQKKLNDLTGMYPAGSAGVAGAPAAGFGSRNQGTTVQSVSGSSALINLSNGSSITVRPGDSIPGIGTVKKISVFEVIVVNGKSIISLPFAGDSASSSQNLSGVQSGAASSFPGAFPGVGAK